MTASPFDHPLLAALLGDEEADRHFTLDAELDAMLTFERALAEAQAETGIISTQAAEAVVAGIGRFRSDLEALRRGVARDGMVVPELVRQLRAAIGPEHGAAVHFGATSQDVADTGLVLRLKPLAGLLDRRLAELDERLAALESRFGDRDLMAVTRMQEAIPIRVGDRVASWRRPLPQHRRRLQQLSERLFVLQFGGPAGTLEQLGDKAADTRRALAGRLGLADAPQWHSQRDRLAEFAGWLSLVSGSLGKFGQDVALMALDGRAIRLTGGGGSSAMPHKKNPVKAEMLVALARFNAAQLTAMHQALVHELERSGAAWTLEWMVLPQMAVATAASLRLGIELAGQIESLGS